MMNKSFVRRLPLFLSAALLAACGSSEEAAVQLDSSGDPGLSAALGEQIMVDPDLVGQNTANNAAAFAPQSGILPELDRSAQAIAAARAEALELLGGAGAVRRAPVARTESGPLPADAVLTAAARAAASGQNNAACADLAEYTMRWAAELPAAFPVYPRAAVQEAAGTNAQGCSLRVVNFLTPVPQSDVLDFYHTRAIAAGFTADRVVQDGDDIIGGVKGASSYVIYTRSRADGVTEVDLVTNAR